MPDSDERGLRVYVLNWNGGDAVSACLDAVLRSEGVAPIVMVVDNGSTDGSRERLAGRIGPDRILALGANRGYAGGMNSALEHLRASGSEHALLLTQDVIVAPDALRRMLEAFADDSGRGIVGPVTIFRERPERVISAGGRIRPRSLRAEHEREVPGDRPYRVDWVDGCCLLVHREAVESVGGFDEEYFLYFEDTDLCHRVAQVGWSVAVAPGALVRHDKSEAPAAHYFHYMTRNRYRFWSRNFGVGPVRVGLAVAIDVLRTLGYWGVSLVPPAPPQERIERRRRFLRQARGAITGTAGYLRGERGRMAAPTVAAPAGGAPS